MMLWLRCTHNLCLACIVHYRVVASNGMMRKYRVQSQYDVKARKGFKGVRID
jgi:hypothetical protein